MYVYCEILNFVKTTGNLLIQLLDFSHPPADVFQTTQISISKCTQDRHSFIVRMKHLSESPK
jgi:hypothetical protein